MSKEYKVGVTLQANAAQYKAEVASAGQTHAAFTGQVQSGSASASGALQSMQTAATAMGAGLRTAGEQGAQGLHATAAAAQASQAAGAALLAGLRDQIAVSGKSTEELLRYRAAQAGVAAEASPLILQLQNQRAAQAAAAEAARTEEAAQRAIAAAKQQATAAQESFLAGLREQAALQGKSSTEALRYRAAQLGVTEGAEQYIRALEAGAKANINGAISAGQHAQAMRMLPAQMTDVVTSVASGMPVWMVAIQQGGQIKDSFGGAGNALRAMLGAITPTVAGLGLLAGAAALATAAYAQGSREADAYRQAIVMTGNAAGTTVGQMGDMARQVSAIVGTQGAASQALAALAHTGQVGADSLRQFAQASIQWERATGTAVGNTAEQFAALAKDPLAATLKLNEGTNYLTDGVYKQIKALTEQGNASAAGAVAQQAWADALTTRADELLNNLGYIETAWLGVKDAAAWAWDSMLNLGRGTTDQQNLDQLRENLARLEERNARPGYKPGKVTEELRAQIKALEDKIAAENADAGAVAGGNEQRKARAAWDKEGEKYLSKQAQMERELAKARGEATAAGASEEELQKRLAAIREKYKDAKGAGGIKVSDAELANLEGQLQAAKLYHEQLVTLGAGASELNAGERESLKIGEQLARTTDAKTAARLRDKQATADALGVQLRANAGLESSIKADRAHLDAIGKTAEKYASLADQQEAANAAMGKSKTAIEEFALAQAQAALASEKAGENGPWNPEHAAAMERAIADQERYVASLKATDYKAAEKHVDELLRGAQELAAAYEDEQQLSGLTALEREKIVAQRAVELKYAKELADIDKSALSDTEKQALREKTLRAQRIESAAAVAKAQQQYMARASDEINRSLTDALMRGFEDGKGMAENLADATVNLFKTMVLRPTISAIMTPVSLVINGVIQQGLNAVGLGSGGNLLGLASNASSIYSIGSQAAGWLGGLFGGGSAGLGLASTTGAGYALSGAGSGLGLSAGVGSGGFFGGGGLGLSAGSAGAGSIGAGLGTGAASSTGASSMLSAIPGWGWALAGLAGIAALVGKFDKSGTPHWGAAAEYDGTTLTGGNDVFVRSGTAGRYTEGAQAGVDAVARAVGDTLNGLGKALGKGGNFGVMTAYSDDSSDDPGFGSLRISRDGQKLLDWEDSRTSKWAPKIFADGEEGWKMYLSAIAKDTRQVLLDMDLPSWANTLLESIGDAASMEDLSAAVAQIGLIAQAFEDLGRKITGFAGLTDTAFERILTASGGIEALGQNAASFYEGFYSETERRDIAKREINDRLAALGVSVDLDASNARELYRKIVEDMLAAANGDDAAAQAAAELLALSEAIKGVTAASEDAAQAAKNQAKAEADARRTATDAAWSALQKSVSAARDAAQAEADLRDARLESARAIVELTRDQARELRGLVDGMVAMTTAQANAWLDNAVTAARDGTLPDAQGLRQAIADARAGMGTGAYRNRQDYEAAQLILANKLDAIGDSGKAQVDVNELLLEQAKNEVDRLDQLLRAGQAALDAARGNTAAVRDVETAVREFYARLFDEGDKTTAKGASGSAAGGSGGGAVFGPGSGGPAAEAKYQRPMFTGSGFGTVYEYVTDPDQLAHLDSLAPVYHKYDGTGDVKGLAADIKAAGGTARDLAWLGGYSERDVYAALDAAGIPRFAGGGGHVGGVRLVGEDGPELEVTGPARIYNASQTQQLLAGLQCGGGTELAAALERLARAVDAQCGALSDIRIHARDTADVLLRVTRGGLAMQSASAVLEL